jgi:hypothetical protein
MICLDLPSVDFRSSRKSALDAIFKTAGESVGVDDQRQTFFPCSCSELIPLAGIPKMPPANLPRCIISLDFEASQDASSQGKENGNVTVS